MSSTFSSSEYVYPTVRPWREIFRDLSAEGYGQNAIAELLGRQPSSVQYWIHESKDLPDSIARSILLLHMRYCGHSATENRLRQEKPNE